MVNKILDGQKIQRDVIDKNAAKKYTPRFFLIAKSKNSLKLVLNVFSIWCNVIGKPTNIMGMAVPSATPKIPSGLTNINERPTFNKAVKAVILKIIFTYPFVTSSPEPTSVVLLNSQKASKIWAGKTPPAKSGPSQLYIKTSANVMATITRGIKTIVIYFVPLNNKYFCSACSPLPSMSAPAGKRGLPIKLLIALKPLCKLNPAPYTVIAETETNVPMIKSSKSKINRPTRLLKKRNQLKLKIFPKASFLKYGNIISDFKR